MAKCNFGWAAVAIDPVWASSRRAQASGSRAWNVPELFVKSDLDVGAVPWEASDSDAEMACAQNIKSTFTRAEKDGSIGAVLELKKGVSIVDVTAKLDQKGTANITLENSTLVPKRESPPPSLLPSV